MVGRVQLFAILGALFVLGFIFELIRRRRLKEQYALLWLLTGLVLLTFALWRDLIDIVGHTLGIAYTPAALILVVTLFFMLILLHFSTVISELSEQNRRLAQRLSLLAWRLEQAHKGLRGRNNSEEPSEEEAAGVGERSGNDQN